MFSFDSGPAASSYAQSAFSFRTDPIHGDGMYRPVFKGLPVQAKQGETNRQAIINRTSESMHHGNAFQQAGADIGDALMDAADFLNPFS